MELDKRQKIDLQCLMEARERVAEFISGIEDWAIFYPASSMRLTRRDTTGSADIDSLPSLSRSLVRATCGCEVR
ncbi:hypothetical protein J6590_072968 [Homalodisca vitripennis]|nr:hypothetical protein J6590_072968 [Homalodisca vitripennis]